jgi:hypothetical protein
MYGKIFTSIYDGTLVEDWRALITFQQLIVLSDADGVVDMTPNAISRRTGIPIEHITKGLKILEKPDLCSRTEGEEGRRIIRMDEHREWGWHIVNHSKYKLITSSVSRREQNRINKQNQRKRQAEKSEKVSECHQVSSMSAHTDTNTDTNTSKDKTLVNPGGSTGPAKVSIPYQKILDLFHEKLPALPRTEKLTEKRRRYIKRLWVEDSLPDLENWGNFFSYVSQSDFLMGRAASNGDRKPFKATLEWITKPENYIKILEANYHG